MQGKFIVPIVTGKGFPPPKQPRLEGLDVVLTTAEKADPPSGKPNAATLAAMAELDAGKGKRYDSVQALMDDLNANN